MIAPYGNSCEKKTKVVSDLFTDFLLILATFMFIGTIYERASSVSTAIQLLNVRISVIVLSVFTSPRPRHTTVGKKKSLHSVTSLHLVSFTNLTILFPVQLLSSSLRRNPVKISTLIYNFDFIFFLVHSVLLSL